MIGLDFEDVQLTSLLGFKLRPLLGCLGGGNRNQLDMSATLIGGLAYAGGLYYPIEEQAVIGSLGANQYDALLTRVLVKQECGPNFISTSN